MADRSQPNAAGAPAESKQPSLKPGCLILGVFGFFAIVVTWIFVVGILINREIGKFTDPRAVELEVLQPSPDQAAAVDAKLKALSQAATQKSPLEIPITAEDLNIMIATQPLLADQRGSTWVDSITPDGLRARMSAPIKKGLFGMRYLNGIFLFVPEKLGNGWQLTLKDIQVPGKPVPPQFIQIFSESRMFRFDQGHPAFKPVLPQLKEIRLEQGQAVVVTWEGSPPEPLPAAKK